MNKIPYIFAVLMISTASSFSSEPSSSIVLFPIQKSTISALTDANIIKYPIKEGESFNSGDIIVQMDDSLYKEYYISANSDMDRAKVALEFSKKIYEQSLDMYKKNGLSLQEMERSKLDYELAKSALEQSAAALMIAKTRLDFCVIRSPFSGRVTKRIKNEYEYVRTGEIVIDIINDKEILAVMNLPSSEVNNVKLGQEKVFYIDELNKTFPGKVYQISGDINPGSRTFEVKALINNSNLELMSGMSGHLVE